MWRRRVVSGGSVCDDDTVPLSENEQRILSEIEAQFYRSDPGLAKEVGTTTVFSHPVRNMKWAALGFVAGLAGMVFLLRFTFWLSFVGFLVMLASAAWFERNARTAGSFGLQQMSEGLRNGSASDLFSRGRPDEKSTDE